MSKNKTTECGCAMRNQAAESECPCGQGCACEQPCRCGTGCKCGSASK